MTIDPTKSGNIPLSGVRPDQAGQGQSARQSGQVRTVSPEAQKPAPPAPPAQDSVNLSADARSVGQADQATSAAGLSRDRLQEVLKRLTSGYYDNPEVVAQVAAKVQQDLTGA